MIGSRRHRSRRRTEGRAPGLLAALVLRGWNVEQAAGGFRARHVRLELQLFAMDDLELYSSATEMELEARLAAGASILAAPGK